MKHVKPKRSRSAIGRSARQKGSSFERKIAHELTAWSGVEIRRTPRSGAFFKTGDITPKDAADMVKWPFHFELKNQNVININHIFWFQKNAGMRKFWDQCESEAKDNNSIPLLVFTRPSFPVFLTTKKEYIDCILKSDFVYNIKAIIYDDKLSTILFSDFLSIPYQKIVKLLGAVHVKGKREKVKGIRAKKTKESSKGKNRVLRSHYRLEDKKAS